MSESTHALFKALDFAFGTYTGTGVNHSGEAFAGTFKLEPVLAGRGFQIRYLATGADGVLYHAEHSLLAPDEHGHLCLWNFNSNAPGLLCHRLEAVKQDSQSVAARFVYGTSGTLDTFREHITLTVESDGAIGYAYAWGLPGEELAERSALTMRRG